MFSTSSVEENDFDEVAVERLTKDLKNASLTLSDAEARFLVDAYYQAQENRIRSDGQRRAIDQSSDVGTKPHLVLDWLSRNDAIMESQIRRALSAYSESREIGRWARSVVGIGPVIAAGLVAHIDITQSETAGQVWRFAGLDSTSRWIGKVEANKFVSDWIKENGYGVPIEQGKKHLSTEILAAAAQTFNKKYETLEKFAMEYGEGKLTPSSVARSLSRRPWNAALKRLCWLIGESFVKVQNNPDDVYGKLYQQRKEIEISKNEKKEFADQARHILETKNIGKATDAYKAYSIGMLPPAHIHARAKRWAVKIFLSHYHQMAYQFHHGRPAPAPFPIAILGHAHRIDPRV